MQGYKKSEISSSFQNINFLYVFYLKNWINILTAESKTNLFLFKFFVHIFQIQDNL